MLALSAVEKGATRVRRVEAMHVCVLIVLPVVAKVMFMLKTKLVVMKNKAKMFNVAVALFIAITGMVVISSCETASSSTRDPYERGYQIGQGLRQVYDATR